MRIDVFTIFPSLVDGFCSESVLGRARTEHLLDLRVHDIRTHTADAHRTVDDSPFGGGAGMVMRPEPIFASVRAAQPPRPLLLLSPGGKRFDQSAANESFEDLLLEAPQYTRPAEFEGHGVPEVLRSGDHERIRRWRLAQSLHRTLVARPDLIERRGGLSDAEKRLLEEFPAQP